MKYDPITRRMFLAGMKDVFLAMPLLTSLLPREAWAQAACPPLRFIMAGSIWHCRAVDLIGSITPNQKIQSGVNVRNLRGLSNISRILHSDFNPVLSKMSVVRGLDVYTNQVHHNLTTGSCASGMAWAPKYGTPPYQNATHNETLAPPISDHSSIDVILANSKKVYPNGISADKKIISIFPSTQWVKDGRPASGYLDLFADRNWSWERGANGLVRPLSVQLDTNALYDTFFKNFTAGGQVTPAPSMNTLPEKDIIAAIFQDYKSVRDSSRISAEDKLRLEAFMSIFNDIQKEVGGGSTPPPATGGSCKTPNRMAEANPDLYDKRIKNQINICALAMACDMTRVASIALNFETNSSENTHNFSHTLGSVSGTNEAGNAALQQLNTKYATAGKYAAYLMNTFDQIPDGQGTLLDNSIFYWFFMHGFGASNLSHPWFDLSAVIGGGSNVLNTGYYIDYRNEVHRMIPNLYQNGNSNAFCGVPMSNLLVTFCQAFGLTPAEYELPGAGGLGEYEMNGYASVLKSYPSAYQSQVTSASYKRSALPFLLKKPNC